MNGRRMLRHDWRRVPGLVILALGLFIPRAGAEPSPTIGVRPLALAAQDPTPTPDRVDAPTLVGQQQLPADGAASLGQQPLPTEQPADQTPSQTNTNQLNQLFQFETTPDVSAAGEGYLSGQFDYLKFPGAVRQYRYQIQGQYGITDQIVAGAFIPVIHSNFQGKHTDLGDVGLYGQYKFDQLINPEIVDVTAQVDVILPTGSRSDLRDTGHFGVRPLGLVYKDFGQQGPGTLGAYGLVGFTLTTNADFRLGLAATYEIHRLAGVLEFFDTTGNRLGRPLVVVTPGLVYRGAGPFEVAAGIPLGVNNGSPHWGVTFKLTYAFQN